MPGSGAMLMPSTTEPTITTERMPPRLSTGAVVSFTPEGTSQRAPTTATTASGRVMRKTEPHQNFSSMAPAASGPSAAIAPPTPDHSAIERVRPGPDHSAVMRARVVGKAMPAARPPKSRAAPRTTRFGAHAAAIEAGTASEVPSTSIILRP